MEKTRTYVDKGGKPLFLELAPHVFDRVPTDCAPRLVDLIHTGELLVPGGNRNDLAELVEIAAQDPEQSLYRILWVEQDGKPQAVLGFGMVAATDDTYDCFGLVATGSGWADEGLKWLAAWLERAEARMLRWEVDSFNEALAQIARSHGFREEGRIEDFYADGAHQIIMVWRPR